MKKHLLFTACCLLLTAYCSPAQTLDEYYQSAITKYNNDDNKGAIEDLTKAIELSPLIANLYYTRANSKYNIQDNEAAIADFNKAIELNPGNGDYYFNRGRAKFMIKDYAGAITDFNKTTEMLPDFGEAWLVLGISKCESGNSFYGCLDIGKAVSLNAPGASDTKKKYCL